jgi:hypothetical protein
LGIPFAVSDHEHTEPEPDERADAFAVAAVEETGARAEPARPPGDTASGAAGPEPDERDEARPDNPIDADNVQAEQQGKGYGDDEGERDAALAE